MNKRNDSLFDKWSVVHLFSGVVAGLVLPPFLALLLLVLWEPFEILVLSPLLAKRGITFGFETLQNSLSDIIFDALGVLIGAYVLGAVITTPIHF
jgi:hypothetical protein